MASSAKKPKVQDRKSIREFQTWWTEKYGMVSKGDNAVLCSGTSSVKQHFETNHKSVSQKSEPRQVSCAATNVIVRHSKSFQEGEFLQEVWLACAPPLFYDFDNIDKIIQRIKDTPLSRNTIKERILKLTENVTDQQKIDISSASFISVCLDESTDVAKSAHLAVFAQYYVGNVIKEEKLFP
ncbi:SCAN domain-containing protein 3-like [Onthophagus taurus]|uniref:SCAN domain-containing protein 3-like n=1 Tax=Onthophagus taurus TaxID=166361 RepID=UPI0039BEAC40